MTRSGGAAEPATAVRLLVSPERVAAGLVAVILAVAVAWPSERPAPAGVPEPSASASPAADPTTRPGVSAAAQTLMRSVLEFSRRMTAARLELEIELEAEPLDTGAAAILIRRIRSSARLCSEHVEGLDAAARAPLPDVVLPLCERVLSITAGALQSALADEAAYRRASVQLVETLRQLPAIDRALLEALQLAAATPSASASGPPPPSASASPASPSPASPSPAPPAATPSPAVASGGLVLNPGFEEGLEPWELRLRDPSVRATLALDDLDPGTGAQAARIEISASSEARSGIALGQGGLAISGGLRYVVRLDARAEAAREIRVAVIGSSGVAYGSRLIEVGPGWTDVSFEFSTIASDPDAFLEIQLGRSGAAVWVDSAFLGPVGSG